MKTKLLYLLLFICSYSYAQIPTNGLVAQYEFTNGALTDAVNTVTFTPSGNALTKVDDRYAVANNGLGLNGNYLTRSDVNYPNHSTFGSPYGQNGTVSFWIKTSTNNADEKIIIDDSNRAALASTTWTGYYIFLKNGNIGVTTRVQYNQTSIGTNGYKSATKIATPFVSDGAWHHVVMTIGNIFASSASGGSDYVRTRTEVFIDGVSYGYSEILDLKPAGQVSLSKSHDSTGDFKIGNNRASNLLTINKYQDEIDDLHIYSRQITQTEVTQLAVLNDFCFPPQVATISAANITETSADISWSVAGTFDMAYVPKGQPFANAVIQTNLLQNASGSLVHSITSLQASTIYNVYIRKQCSAAVSSKSYSTNQTSSATYSSWSSTPVEVRTNGIMYVNINATGTNDGTSWANAFTDLQDALSALQDDSEIWVAQGTYKTDALIRNNPFTIDKENVKMYGGFNGTETTLGQRDFRTNITILSGDIAGDDVNGTNLNDNSYHVIYVSSNGANIDGFTISNGVANGTATNAYGAGIFKTRPVNSLTVKNSIIKNNFGLYAAGIAAEYESASGSLDIENCVFDNNTGRFGAALYVQTRAIGTFLFNVSNSLFKNNEAKDLGGAGTGYAGSAGFFQANNNWSTSTVKLTNNTYVNNNDIGTHATMSNLTRGTVGANHPAGTLNLEVANCIFYDNTITGGTVANAITGMNNTIPSNITVVNSIDEDGFSKLNVANLTNTNTADPLFTSATDFTLQATSPAINMGGNTYLPSTITTDLSGNDRISIAKIDAGAYEYQCTTCFGVNTEVVGSGTVSQNGVIYNNGDTATLTATPTSGYIFEGWSGDASGTTNPLVLTVTANKSITATFSKSKIYVNVNATGNNDGTSWTNAYLSLQDAVTNATTDDVIWIAAGTYKAGNTPSDSFIFTSDNIKVYGGFNGTEVNLTDRTLTNPTILSGDINGDDLAIGATGIEQNPTLSGRVDNSYVIVKIVGNNILLDGFVISDGHYNNSASGHGFGSAILKDDAVTAMTLKNCKIIKNFNFNGGAVSASFTLGGNLTIENCKFDSNAGKYGSGVYVIGRNNKTVTVDITNSLFTNNISKDLSQQGFSGSSMWIRANGAGSNVTTTITNSTFAKNTDIGTRHSTVRGTVAVSRVGNSTHNVVVNNSIFYDNKGTQNATTKAIVQAHSVFPNSVTVSSSIDEDNFSNITSTRTNTSNSNPLFADKANNDFTLLAGSPAIDTGDNSKIPAGITTDLLGNQRIFNTTVDMGAYEYNTPITQRTLTINATNGTVTSNPIPTNGTYDDGTVVGLTATPATGYQFDGWSDDASGTLSSVNITMDADKTVTATFSLIPVVQRTLTINATNGTVTSNPIPTNGTYDDGTVVGLTATPATGYQFDGWSGDASGTSSSVNITMDADKTVTATFSKIQRTLTINSINGSVNVSGSFNSKSQSVVTGYQFYHGDIATLTPVPATGYQFDGWSGDASGTTNPLSITMDADKTVTATFSLISVVQRTLTINATNGTVTSNPIPTNGTYDDGTVVGLTATPATGYQFDGWSGDASGTPSSVNITMDADKTVTATFSLIPVVQRTLTINATNGTVTSNPSPTNGTYDDGTVVGLTATPATGYQFDGWSGDASGTPSSVNITMDADKTVTATFSLIPVVQRTLTINATNGTVTSNPIPTNGTYDDGTVVGLTATPATGYQFDGWSGDASGTSSSVNITMDADKTVTATFSLIPVVQRTLTINATNGTVTSNPIPTNGTYDDGTVVGLTATPATGYQFDGWSDDASGTSSSVNITMDADKTVTATFSLIPVVQRTLTINATNGTVTSNPIPTNGTYARWNRCRFNSNSSNRLSI